MSDRAGSSKGRFGARRTGRPGEYLTQAGRYLAIPFPKRGWRHNGVLYSSPSLLALIQTNDFNHFEQRKARAGA